MSQREMEDSVRLLWPRMLTADGEVAEEEFPKLVVVCCAVGIGVAAAGFGIWFSSRQQSRPYQGSLLGTVAAGVLTGISLLSVLPDAVDVLVVEYEWRTQRVMRMWRSVTSGARAFVRKRRACERDARANGTGAGMGHGAYVNTRVVA